MKRMSRMNQDDYVLCIYIENIYSTVSDIGNGVIYIHCIFVCKKGQQKKTMKVIDTFL